MARVRNGVAVRSCKFETISFEFTAVRQAIAVRCVVAENKERRRISFGSHARPGRIVCRDVERAARCPGPRIGYIGLLHHHRLPVHLHRAPVVLGVDGGNLIGIEADVGDQVGEQFAFVAGALQAGVEAHIQGVAVFLQHHGRELLEAEVACNDPVGIDKDDLVAIGPHLGIGADGAPHLGVVAQLDRDPQAGGADRLQQRLLVGLKHRGLGAGPAEHLVQQGVAIGSGEQLRQISAGLHQGLVPQAGRRGAQHRQAVVHHHVLDRGVFLRINHRPLLRREHHAADLSRKQLPLIARAIHAAIEAPIQGVAKFLQQGAGGQVHVQQAVVELVGIHIDALAFGVAAGRIGREGASEFVVAAQIHRDLKAVAAQGGQ